MTIHKPYVWEIEEFKVSGAVKDYDREEGGKWFIFETKPKSKGLKKGLEELKPRIQKVEKRAYNYFRIPSFQDLPIRAIYLNEESENGLYKDPENNLPYEIHSISGDLLYRQSTIETKKNIFNKLEKAAIEEGLRNK
jgi:hypothetical protein